MSFLKIIQLKIDKNILGPNFFDPNYQFFLNFLSFSSTFSVFLQLFSFSVDSGWLSWNAAESLRAFVERVFADFRDKNAVLRLKVWGKTGNLRSSKDLNTHRQIPSYTLVITFSIFLQLSQFFSTQGGRGWLAFVESSRIPLRAFVDRVFADFCDKNIVFMFERKPAICGCQRS